MKRICNSAVELYISPSIIQQFFLNPEWGLRTYNQVVRGIFQKPNYLMNRGKYLHRIKGYNNKITFYKTTILDIDGRKYTLGIEGTPDHLNPLKELKTTGKNYNQKLVDAAALQLRGYMFLTGEEYGYVVIMDRKDGVELVDVMVRRDDEQFLKWVRKFFEYKWNVEGRKCS